MKSVTSTLNEKIELSAFRQAYLNLLEKEIIGNDMDDL